jgi:ketosteroid isomerase-like protein
MMKMARFVPLAALLCSMAVAATPPLSPAVQQVTALLHEFLAGAGGGDPALYDRFFADDVVYTRSSGAFTTKAMIMDSVRKPSSDPPSHFSGEDLTVHEYGDTVVVAFRLVGKIEQNGKTETLQFRNTGTFLRRNGRWQVVAWQATKIAEAPPAK